MILEHVSLKAIASGTAAFVGSTSIILATQHAPMQGIEFITQYEWSTVVLSVLAAYGITWRVPNASPSDSASGAGTEKKQGDHVA